MKIRSVKQESDSHKAADKACGRKWECACKACTIQRRKEQTNSPDEAKNPIMKSETKSVEWSYPTSPNAGC